MALVLSVLVPTNPPPLPRRVSREGPDGHVSSNIGGLRRVPALVRGSIYLYFLFWPQAQLGHRYLCGLGLVRFWCRSRLALGDCSEVLQALFSVHYTVLVLHACWFGPVLLPHTCRVRTVTQQPKTYRYMHLPSRDETTVSAGPGVPVPVYVWSPGVVL